MAFLDLHIDPIAGGSVTVPAGLADFTAIEWRVIDIARRERPAASRSPSPICRLLAALVGMAVANPLADPRLEALRRAAGVAWHAKRILDRREIDTLLAAGFSFAQVALLGSVCRT